MRCPLTAELTRGGRGHGNPRPLFRSVDWNALRRTLEVSSVPPSPPSLTVSLAGSLPT